jgi:cyclase
MSGAGVSRRFALSGALLLCGSLSAADSSVTKVRTVTELAPGVWTIRHPDAPDTFPQSNTTVIAGEREVLVVDSCYMPSSAREDIAFIREKVGKPVRYLLNTHWHYDHTMGNGEYAAAYPGISVVAHRETARNMAGYNPPWFERYPVRTADFRKQLETGLDAAGKALTPEARKEIETILPGREPVAKEFAAIRDRIPDTVFDSELELDLGGRVVQIKYLGRGNTAGDAIVYLPKEKLLVTGDLLVSPVPYLGGGFPTEMAATLRAMSQLDAAIIVPGHGEVQRDKKLLLKLIDFIEALQPHMSRAIYTSANRGDLDTVKAAVLKTFDVTPWRTAFVGDGTDKDNVEYFDTFSWPGILKAMHAEMWRR